MNIRRLTILINLLGLAALQVGLILDQRLILSWVPLGLVWTIAVVVILALTLLYGRQDRQDQL